MTARSSARKAESEARKAKASPAVRALARTGIGARALTYLVLAYLTVDLAASGGRSPRADTKGVLEELAHRPAGPVLVLLLAAGFALYAGWRVLQAVAGDASVDGGTEAAKRLGWGAIGAVYLALAAQAVAVVAEGRAGQRSPQSVAGGLLGVPGGRVLLALVGVGVLAGGVILAGWAALQRFEVFMPFERMPLAGEVASRVVGTFGHVVRGLVLAAIGSSFVLAAVAGSAQDAKDLNSALRVMRHHSYGTWVLGLVAAGFLAYAAMSALEAAYREL